MHYQTIKRPGRGLLEVTCSPKRNHGRVEIPDGNALVLGVQWHPEELTVHDRVARSLFRTLVAAAESNVR